MVFLNVNRMRYYQVYPVDEKLFTNLSKFPKELFLQINKFNIRVVVFPHIWAFTTYTFRFLRRKRNWFVVEKKMFYFFPRGQFRPYAGNP